MKEAIVKNIKKIKKAQKEITNKIHIEIKNEGKKFTITGAELDEYLAYEIIKAIDFGFDAEDALMLLNPDFIIQYVNIKDFTKKKNLQEVRARVIGARGRAKGTIEELTGSRIVLHENQVAIICDSSHLDSVIYAVSAIIRGSKHANVFAYLEKQNRESGKFDDEDLGLKIKEKQK